MRAVYDESLNDPNLLNIRESLALLNVVVSRTIEQTEELDTPDFRNQAIKAFRAARKAHRREDAVEFEEKFRELGALLKRGDAEHNALMAMCRAVKTQADTILRVWETRLKQAQVINERDLSAIFMRLHDVIIDHSPQDVSKKLLSEMERLILIPMGASKGQTGDGYVDMPCPSGSGVREVEIEFDDDDSEG